MPLQPLTRIIVSNNDNGLQTSRLPNNQEMMDKINEIVNFVNRLEREKQSKEIVGFKPRSGY
jgi:hypothetical protein